MNIQQDIVLHNTLIGNILPRLMVVGYSVFYEHLHQQVRSLNMMIFNLCKMFLNLPLGAGLSPWDWTLLFFLVFSL
jgi:hypothetical protein